MTITSAGYAKVNSNPGQIDATQWAKQVETLGSDYGVVGDSWKVTPITSAPRSVSITAGIGYGRGIYDVSDALVNVQAQPLGTGTTTRWDTVVAHRDWSSPATTFLVIPGTPSQVIAPTRATSPGQVDDQPIALIKLESSTPVPTQVVDLRKWNGKTSFVNDLRAVVDPDIGDEVVDVSGARWRYVLSNGNLTRVRVSSQSRFQRSGTDIDGILGSVQQSPQTTFTAHGYWHGITTPSGRSELSDAITFDVPMQTLFDLQLTQIHKPPVLSAPRFVEIASSANGFQAAWIETVATGSAPPAERAFRWTATGIIN